ncbi:MAG: DUF3011 domain-containing protein [Candidatus Acidiferrum sp.]
MRICRLVFATFVVLSPLTRIQAQTVTCSSDDGKRNFCAANTRGGVQMVNQRSGSPCTQGYSWGYDEHGIWVDHGCRADFTVGGSGGPGNAGGQLVTCSSDDGEKKYCEADTRYGAQMENQRSGSPCKQGYSWGYDEQGIWVDHGCRADFAVGSARDRDHDRDGDRDHDKDHERVSSTTVSCASDDGRRNYCEAETRHARVRMTRQLSGAPCVQGSTWGFDDRGIWVDRGCRAEFLVQTGERPDDREHGRKSCLRSVGEHRAKELVEQCMQVSPGTHPPCNAENECKVITEEIRRGCELQGRDAPGFCAEYR